MDYKVKSYRLNLELIKRIETIAKKLSLRESDFIRLAISEKVIEYEEKLKIT